MGEHERHGVDGPEAAEHPARAVDLRQGRDVVRLGVRRDEDERIGVPGMPVEQGRRRMVRGHDEDVGLEREQARDEAVDLFDGRDLLLEVPVLAGRVRLLEVDIEEIVVRVFALEGVEEVRRLGADVEDVHAEELGQPLVHRVVGDGRRPELVELGHVRDGGKLGEAPEEGRVGRGLVLEERRQLVQEPVDDDGRPPGLGLERGGLNAGLTVLLGIGVGQDVRQGPRPGSGRRSDVLFPG